MKKTFKEKYFELKKELECCKNAKQILKNMIIPKFNIGDKVFTVVYDTVEILQISHLVINSNGILYALKNSPYTYIFRFEYEIFTDEKLAYDFLKRQYINYD